MLISLSKKTHSLSPLPPSPSLFILNLLFFIISPSIVIELIWIFRIGWSNISMDQLPMTLSTWILLLLISHTWNNYSPKKLKRPTSKVLLFYILRQSLASYRQLDKIMSQVDCLQNLLDRLGGAKQSGQTRRSSPQDISFDTLSYKLSDCSSAVQKLETTVSLIYYKTMLQCIWYFWQFL